MLNLLDSLFAAGVVPASVYLLRAAFIPLLIYNLWWSAKGGLLFWKKQEFPISMYKTMIAFFTVGALARAVGFFWNYPHTDLSPAALVGVCVTIIASILAAYTHRFNLAQQLRTFYWLVSHENVELAVRTAELAKFDRKYMKGVLDNAETDIAVGLAKKARQKSE